MIFQIEPKFVEEIPSEIEEGVIYISRRYKIATHLCACGCKQKTVTPLGVGEWNLTESNNQVTLRPSVGNFAGENPYHAHYYITNNKIEWL
jgi:hypothetical protein